MVTSLKRSQACIATVHALNSAAGHHPHRKVQDILLWGYCSFLLGPGAQGSVVSSKSLFPILCKLWQLYGGVNGDLLYFGGLQNHCRW